MIEGSQPFRFESFGGQAHQVEFVPPREVPDLMKRPDPLALVRRTREERGDVEDPQAGLQVPAVLPERPEAHARQGLPLVRIAEHSEPLPHVA